MLTTGVFGADSDAYPEPTMPPTPFPVATISPVNELFITAHGPIDCPFIPTSPPTLSVPYTVAALTQLIMVPLNVPAKEPICF